MKGGGKEKKYILLIEEATSYINTKKKNAFLKKTKKYDEVF